MPLPQTLNVALKEWDSVCRALATGRQIILLRKGGIYDNNGEFEVQHKQFLLFPTYLHQNLKLLKPQAHADFRAFSGEPPQVALDSAAAVTDVIQIKSRSQMDAIDDEHIWTTAQIDMRFSYRPDNPLYLLLLRAYRLASPIPVANTPEYAGCKSWVPLNQDVATQDARPALDDVTYHSRQENIMKRIG